MQRLLDDAEKISGVQYDMSSLSDVYDAIHVVQTELGITGTTADEASSTISGSISSAKAALSDFLTSLADGSQDSSEKFGNLKDTMSTAFENVAPKILEVLSAMSPLVTVVAGLTAAFVTFKTAMAISSVVGAAVNSFNAFKTANEGATVAQWAMNAAMNANPIVLVVTLIAGLVAALVTLIATNEDFRNNLIAAWEKIKTVASDVWNGVANFFKETIPEAFKDLVESAKNWGKDLIDKFIGGIKEKWENLKSAVSDVANTVKDFLGFSEPKKGPLSNFHTYAPDMMELFAKGIRENEDVVSNQLDKSFDFGSKSVGLSVSNLSNLSSPMAASPAERDTFVFNVDAKNIKELNDLVRIAQNARFTARMGVA